jgi:adenosylmethionine-8-amino-7-oxononanoate aminotransferase
MFALNSVGVVQTLDAMSSLWMTAAFHARINISVTVTFQASASDFTRGSPIVYCTFAALLANVASSVKSGKVG